jgi:hypothetical protein
MKSQQVEDTGVKFGQLKTIAIHYSLVKYYRKTPISENWEY